MPKLYWRQLFVGLLVEFSSLGSYRLIQNVTPGKFHLGTWLDTSLSFWPSWILIYSSILLVFLVAASVLRPELFKITLKRVVLAHIITYPFFFLLPSDYPRLESVSIDPDTFFGWGYGIMHTLDQANNTFPSLHVSLTWIICHMLRKNGYSPWLTYTYAILISLSTLLTKQHFVIDVIGGYMIFLSTITIERFFRKRFEVVKEI